MARGPAPVVRPGQGFSGNAPGAAQGSLPSLPAGIFQGLEGISAALTAYASGVRQQEDIAEGLRVAEAEDAFALALAEKTKALDPTAEDYAERVQKAVAEQTQATISASGLKGQHRQAQLREALSRQGTAALIRSLGAQQEALQNRAISAFEQGAETAFNQMLASPGDWDAIKTGFLAKVAPALDALPADARQAMVTGFLNKAVIHTAIGRADAGDFAGAQKFLADNAGSIDADVVFATKQRIENLEQQRENERRAAAAAARAAEVERLKQRVLAAELDSIENGDPALADAPDGFYADGQNAEEVAQLRQIALNVDGLTKAQMRSRREAIDTYVAGRPLSPAQSDVVFNAHLKLAYEGAKRAGLPENAAMADAYVTTARRMLTQTGQVPPTVVSRISTRSRSGDPDALAEAAYFADSLTQAAPWAVGIDTGLSDRGKIVAEEARARAGGVPTLDHYRAAAAELGGLSAADLESRRKAANTAFADAPLKTLGEIAGITDARAALDFDKARKRFYGITGDAEKANRLAAEEVKKSYSTTRVGGVERPLRGPSPEQSYPALLHNTMGPEWVAERITASVKRDLEALGVALPPAPEGQPAFVLQPDEQTVREQKTGRVPSFLVMVPDANTPGVYRPVTVREGGKLTIVRWTGPANEAEALADPEIAKELAHRRDRVSREAARQNQPFRNHGPIQSSYGGGAATPEQIGARSDAADEAEAQKAADADAAATAGISGMIGP